MIVKQKNCLTCDKPVRGRTDKKFCDDYCRNNYNNHLKAETNCIIRNINNALGKNRRILESLIPTNEEMGMVSKEKLLLEGFLFKYFTHTKKSTKGGCYFFCYDHGYMMLENECYLIIKQME